MLVPEDLDSRLIGMIAHSKKVAPESIGLGTTFDSLAIDSLDKINLSFEIEEAFAIDIPDTAIGSIRTVGDMVEGVRGLVAAKAA
jgi:acyl carrier protein